MVYFECREGTFSDISSLSNPPQVFVGSERGIALGEDVFYQGRIDHRQVASIVQRVRQWEFVHVFQNGFVEMAAKRICCGKITTLGPHGHKTIRVNNVKFAGVELKGCFKNMSWVIRWEVIDDAGSCLFQPDFEKSRGFFGTGFDIGNVRDSCLGECGSVVDHPLENERRDAVISPAVIESEAFDYDERLLVLIGQVDCMLEGMVPVSAPS